MLKGVNTSKLEPTHYYLKFTPEDGVEVSALEDYAEENGYEFEIQPVHYEVVYEGDEGYAPLPEDEEGIVPEYVTVSSADYTNGSLPDVSYDIVAVMHIPKYESLLTFTAFVLSGNEKYYEAVDGFCHPDCPSWPLCLDEPAYTCKPPEGETVRTMDPSSTKGRNKFPSYVLDDKIGPNGEFDPTRECSEILNSMPDCPDNCTPILVPIEHEPDACRWECQCVVDDDDDGGGVGPPPGLVERCGCFVYEDEKKPGGRIILEDTQLGDEGVQHVKILATRYHWGFIYKNTDTDQNGCWKINKQYRSRKAKVKVVFRDRVSDRLTVRSWRGWRIWNTILKPVKHKFKLTRNDKVWNDLCLRIEDTDDEQSQAEEAFVAATVNNAVHDFYGFENLLGVNNLNYLIHTQATSWKSAPMLGKMVDFEVGVLDFFGLMADDETVLLDSGLGDFLASNALPDVTIPFVRQNDPHVGFADPFYGSDDIVELVYHETAHTVQFSQVGSLWWQAYVLYIINAQFHQEECQPYGFSALPNHGFAEITEGMATAIGFYYADLKYGDDHSTNNRINESTERIGRFINKAELLDFWKRAECGRFIPEGLFFDLFDENDVFPASLQFPEIKELQRLTTINMDRVHRVSFETQLSALNSSVQTIDQFKESLKDKAMSLGVSEEDYNELFRAYGH